MELLITQGSSAAIRDQKSLSNHLTRMIPKEKLQTTSKKVRQQSWASLEKVKMTTKISIQRMEKVTRTRRIIIGDQMA
jgi:hypothetical protein